MYDRDGDVEALILPPVPYVGTVSCSLYASLTRLSPLNPNFQKPALFSSLLGDLVIMATYIYIRLIENMDGRQTTTRPQKQVLNM